MASCLQVSCVRAMCVTALIVTQASALTAVGGTRSLLRSRAAATAARAHVCAYEGEKFSREVRIKEELASPLRGFRFFAYAGMVLGGGTSGFIALTGLLATLAGKQGGVAKEQLITNLAIDVGVLVLAGLGVYSDLRWRDQNLERIAALLDAKGAERKAAGVSADDDTDLFIGSG